MHQQSDENCPKLVMDFKSAMETFAEAWAAANGSQNQPISQQQYPSTVSAAAAVAAAFFASKGQMQYLSTAAADTLDTLNSVPEPSDHASVAEQSARKASTSTEQDMDDIAAEHRSSREPSRAASRDRSRGVSRDPSRDRSRAGSRMDGPNMDRPPISDLPISLIIPTTTTASATSSLSCRSDASSVAGINAGSCAASADAPNPSANTPRPSENPSRTPGYHRAHTMSPPEAQPSIYANVVNDFNINQSQALADSNNQQSQHQSSSHQQQQHHQQQQNPQQSASSVVDLKMRASGAVTNNVSSSQAVHENGVSTSTFPMHYSHYHHQQQQQQQRHHHQQQLQQQQQQQLPVSSSGSTNDMPTTATDRRDAGQSNNMEKTIPLHCVVECVLSLQSPLPNDVRSQYRRRPNVESDSFILLPAATLFVDIVSAALKILGYTPDIVCTARGSIAIKNWKPMPVEQVCDNPQMCTGDVLGDLHSMVTLRIVVLRAKQPAINEVKEKLLRLLLLNSHSMLRSTGCPLDEFTLSQLSRSYQGVPGVNPEISAEVREKFDQWWLTHFSSMAMHPMPRPKLPLALPFLGPHPHAAAAMHVKPEFANLHQHAAHGGPLHGGSRDPLGFDSHFPSLTAQYQQHQQQQQQQQQQHHSQQLQHLQSQHQQHQQQLLSQAQNRSMVVHPALQRVHTQYPNQKTRMRTSFDPELELPKLQHWFHENPHPSRQQIQAYVLDLNGLDSRRGRKPLDINNVVYWFKNARAAQKRLETRSQSSMMLSNGYGGASAEMMLAQSEYMKSPMSLDVSDEVETGSPAQSDDDDDDNEMPQLPLSLTIHERHRPPSSANLNTSAGAAEASSSRRSSTGVNGSQETVTATGADSNSAVGGGSAANDTTPGSIGGQTSSSSINNNNNSISSINSIKQEHSSSPSQPMPTEHSEPIRSRSVSLDLHSQRNHSAGQEAKMDDAEGGVDESQPNSRDDSPQSDDELDLDADEYRSLSGPDSKHASAMPFPAVPNSVFQHSIMYMSHYIPQMAGAQGHGGHGHGLATGGGLGALGSLPVGAGGLANPRLSPGLMHSQSGSQSIDERRKRNRTFIDPVTEVPKLEKWFGTNTHPTQPLISKFTEDLNRMPYRQKFPRLESKNVQFWFKNRRAKNKRMKVFDPEQRGLMSGVHMHNETDPTYCDNMGMM